ncbi:hypothetical protein HYH02_007857 [Chlamydomonas schloesseri]|uniref:Uncharacterized protein n=1 Tax=Chlamydomonas schloesseri TaxID=2026947 RepID=A0A835WH24_9CHLO|nr:hypothetical protein HYH02_007857 [Chlamydomonas schloesseri]|eukprot:KAG2447109.1 hypothetical protein HYH02_007857 [Chlamydomonas schloesseri]
MLKVGADEEDFLELLVANERVQNLIDRIRARGNPTRQKQALLQLKQAVESRVTYAEEARQAGVVPVLTRLLGLTDDEEVLDAASAVIAACSGPMATAGKVSTYSYEGCVVRIREAALGDGLGAKVWQVAHMLCLELAAQRAAITHMALAAAGSAETEAASIAAGATGEGEEQGEARQWDGVRVLELGSGCGVCGLAAAAMLGGSCSGAAGSAEGSAAVHVVMTDVEGPVLRNLRACMHLNADADAAAAATAAADQQQQPEQQQQQQALPTDEELFDDAEEVEDFGADLVFELAGGGGDDADSSNGCGGGGEDRAAGARATGPDAWERGNTSVRLLDWMESARALDEGPEAAAVAAAEAAAKGGPDMPPRVALEERFPLIIGSEVMYERAHAELVAAVVAHRLAPGGGALLHCAVRELKVFAHFAAECRRRGLRYRRRVVVPAAVFGAAACTSGVLLDAATAGAAVGTCTAAAAATCAGAGGLVLCPFEGLLGRADEYEGGIVLMAVDHSAAPCEHWYRDDWEEVVA